MPAPYKIDIDVASADLTGFASNVTGGTFTIATTATTDGLAHQVSIRNDSVTDHTDKTIALTGTDSDGNAQTETVTGPDNGATVESTKYFKTLTSAVPSATIGVDTFDIGWVDEVASPTIPLNWRSSTACNCAVDVTGTIDFTVQVTFDDIRQNAAPQQNLAWLPVSALQAKTADTIAALPAHATGARLIVNSYSTDAELQVWFAERPTGD